MEIKMGTSCQVHAEVKINGEWHHYSQGRFPPYYELFAQMAGVRDYNGIIPISAPKGLPEYITLITRIDRESHDGIAHNDSWFNLQEIKTIENWYDLHNPKQDIFILSSKLNYLFGNSFSSFVEHREDYPEEIEDVRWVFWFD